MRTAHYLSLISERAVKLFILPLLNLLLLAEVVAKQIRRRRKREVLLPIRIKVRRKETRMPPTTMRILEWEWEKGKENWILKANRLLGVKTKRTSCSVLLGFVGE